MRDRKRKDEFRIFVDLCMHEVCGVMYVSSMKRQSLQAASIFEYRAFGARVMAAEQRNANLAATAILNDIKILAR